MDTLHARELYEEDFFAWTRSQARALLQSARSRPDLPLDLEHIAEEIADLGTSRRNALRSWTRRIIEHLLLLQQSPARDRRHGGVEEVLRFRSEIEGRLSATLRRDTQKRLDLYGEAGTSARLPARCPYTLDQVLGDVWPDAANHGDRQDRAT